MVASLYFTNTRNRFDTMLRQASDDFAKQYGVPSKAFCIFPKLGFATTDCTYKALIPILQRMKQDGAIAVGFIVQGCREDGAESVRCHFVNKSESYSAEAIVERSQGWPLLGEWQDIEPLFDPKNVFPEAYA